MAVNSFNEGAVSPLLSIWRHTLWLSGVLLLSAYGSYSELPPFTTNGCVGNQGAVRIQHKDSGDDVHLLSVFSPWHKGETTTSEHRWQGDSLFLIELNVYSKPAEYAYICFDDRGELSFMRREVDGQKQQLSGDQITLYHYRADQIRQTSDALRQGRVILRRGRWHADNTVTICEGETLKPDLKPWAISHIERRQRHSSVGVSATWLEAPEGSQLLLIASEDFCHQQPTARTF